MTDTTQDPFAAPPDAAQPEALPRAMPDFTSLSLHKVALVAGIAIATIVPNLLISNLVEEREQRQSGVRAEFTRNWGPEQTVLGPVLVIPYQAGERPRTYVQDRGSASSILRQRSIRQERRRGLFSATVYDATLDMQGAFVVPPEARLREFVTDKDGRFIWSEAAIAFGTQVAPHRAAAHPTTSRSTARRAAVGALPRGACARSCLQGCRRWCWRTRRSPLADDRAARACTFKSARQPARHRVSSRCIYAGKELVGGVPLILAVARASAATRCRLNSTVSADGFEANWQTTEFGSPRITAVDRDRGPGDVERRDASAST